MQGLNMHLLYTSPSVALLCCATSTILSSSIDWSKLLVSASLKITIVRVFFPGTLAEANLVQLLTKLLNLTDFQQTWLSSIWSKWLAAPLLIAPPLDGGGWPRALLIALLAFFSSSSLQAYVTGTVFDAVCLTQHINTLTLHADVANRINYRLVV